MTSESELKDAAQRALDGPRPGEVYRHYKGGIYSVVCTSVDEATTEPLVTYHSNLKGTNWTRTLKNFTERVTVKLPYRDEAGGSVWDAVPRFQRLEE